MFRLLAMPLLIVAWVVTLGLGCAWVLLYQTTPGQSADAAMRWPAHSTLLRKPGNYTLILFLHPYCPCSRVSSEELTGIIRQCRSRVNAHLLVVVPPGAPPSWKDDSTNDISIDPAIATLKRDMDGKEAKRFGARTSGQVFLYDSEGQCRFQGGITAGRGHIGDNAGRRAVLEWLAHGTSERGQAPVFGCPLFEDGTDGQGDRE